MTSTTIRNQTLKQINEAIEEGLRRGLIIIRGPFQSEKTVILRQLLRQKKLPEKENFLNLNQFLINQLKKEISQNPALSFELLSRLPGKTTALFESYIERYLPGFLEAKRLLIIDSVELLLHYPVNLPQIIYRFCQDQNTIILAVPHDLKNEFILDWNFNIAKVIDIQLS